MTILIGFLTTIAASYIGVLLAAVTVDKFQDWKNKWR